MSIKGCMWSATIFRSTVAFKWWLIHIKRPNMCQENDSSHHYTNTNTTRVNCWCKAGWVHGFMPSVPTICSTDLWQHNWSKNKIRLWSTVSKVPVKMQYKHITITQPWQFDGDLNKTFWLITLNHWSTTSLKLHLKLCASTLKLNFPFLVFFREDHGRP